MNREELLKNAKQILFNTEMVKAILEDRKTVTRRVIKVYSDDFIGYVSQSNKKQLEGTAVFGSGSMEDIINARIDEYVNVPYKPGDILYVRETWSYVYEYGSEENLKWEMKKYVYKTDESLLSSLKWKPSIHMSKEAARIFLKVTNVRVERLQDITPRGAIKEGCNGKYNYDEYDSSESIRMFVDLWNSTINKKDLDSYGWEANPYVWVIEFERVNYDR